MNGIIHACSHPSDGDAHFRITEQQIFLNIFNYIENLFYKIRPKKLFFLAVDGVAPRAKMNQQRARRFRSAKDAAELKKKALARGEVLPDEAPFDSNCITPGTEFMTNLSAQLRYFISKKVNEDANWRDVEVVLSGHDVPGEGEHKIMEYLRLAKSRENYDSNIRHCLYGLDADLIMLGLLSHEPHFALLREEVTFGRTKKKTSATSNPETQKFYLMHLSLMREYLDKEFIDLKGTLPFAYDLERLIDDFILMAFFVGNDFLPNLPGLHINEGALVTMFDVYKRIMPTQDGYLNEFGVMNLRRCQAYLGALGDIEKQTFESEQVDSKWLRGRMRGGDRQEHPHGHRGSKHHQQQPRFSGFETLHC
jgi:5'-3' exoribonuclease 1